MPTERERADVILQLGLQRIETLTATVAELHEDAPTAAPEAPGRDERSRMGEDLTVWQRLRRRLGNER